MKINSTNRYSKMLGITTLYNNSHQNDLKTTTLGITTVKIQQSKEEPRHKNPKDGFLISQIHIIIATFESWIHTIDKITK